MTESRAGRYKGTWGYAVSSSPSDDCSCSFPCSSCSDQFESCRFRDGRGFWESRVCHLEEA